jgi:hypothetical protein
MKSGLILGGAVAVLLFGAFVWPTAWRYDEYASPTGRVLIRTSRFGSGATERLGPYGWVDPAPPGTPLPRSATPCPEKTQKNMFDYLDGPCP